MHDCENCGGPTRSRGSRKFIGPLRYFCSKPECESARDRGINAERATDRPPRYQEVPFEDEPWIGPPRWPDSEGGML